MEAGSSRFLRVAQRNSRTAQSTPGHEHDDEVGVTVPLFRRLSRHSSHGTDRWRQAAFLFFPSDVIGWCLCDRDSPQPIRYRTFPACNLQAAGARSLRRSQFGVPSNHTGQVYRLEKRSETLEHPFKCRRQRVNRTVASNVDRERHLRQSVERVKERLRIGGGGGSRTFPQPLEPVSYTFDKENEVPKGPLCRGYRTRIVHGGFLVKTLIGWPTRRSSCVKGAVVEAGRIGLPSEETNDRERSCFSHVHLCLVSVA